MLPSEGGKLQKKQNLHTPHAEEVPFAEAQRCVEAGLLFLMLFRPFCSSKQSEEAKRLKFMLHKLGCFYHGCL